MTRRGRSRLGRSLLGLIAVGGIHAGAALAAEPAAKHGGVHPRVAELARVLTAAEEPERYAALRELWSAWDTSDPVPIEATLRAFATDPTESPPLRSYAGLLEAYARRRRGDREGSERRIDALGFVRSWLVVGPFDNPNRGGLGERLAPEVELDAPVFEDRAFQGKQRRVVWRAAPDTPRLGWLDLGGMVRPNRDVCVFATTYLRSRAHREATLFVGAAGAFKLYFDAAEVLVDGSYRELDADRFSVPVTLEAGRPHRVTVKVCGDDEPPTFTLRLADDAGAPLTDVTIEANETVSTEAAMRMRSHEPPPVRTVRPKRARRGDGPLGAVQSLDRFLAAAPEDPARLEAYARYLRVTGGDGADEHQARDLADRAATRAPTVDRLLLAASLAEDRNGRRAWLERARPLAITPVERAKLVRAEVELARGGPAPLDAHRLSRELVRLDPLDPVGRLGLVEQLADAGLGRTAESELERAIALSPRSLVMLRAATIQLRSLGRDADAAAIEARYAEFRADDPGVIERGLDLSVARRDAGRARVFADRLLAAQPTNPWAHDRVAKALRALGDTDAARRTYQRLLSIAPEDTSALRALAELHGERGELDRARELLRTIVRLSPQDSAARDYLERIEPARARDDERLAWPDERFRELASRTPATGVASRTLRNLVVTTVWESGLTSHFHQRVFQPLTEDAARQARRFSFAYHSDRQVVELRGVRVFRKDGRVDETVTTGESPLDDPAMNLYTLERVFHVQLPELHAGDLVELRYRVDDVISESELSDHLSEIEFLQEGNPVASAEYVLSTPASRPIFAHATGLPGVVTRVETLGSRTLRHFVATDLPAAPSEPGGRPAAEALGCVHASSQESWSAVGRFYWGIAKDKLEPDDEIRRLAREVTRGATDLQGRVAAVYRHAANETRYVALEFGVEGIRPRRASLTLARGWGDCKDKAALIVAMLRSLGIDAEMVLVRTGLRGRFDPTVASLAPFDHAVAYVPALDRYLDGTAEASGSGELPSLDRGGLALHVTPTGGRLVHLPEVVQVPARDERLIALDLESGGALRFEARLTISGPDAPAFRRRYRAEATQAERLQADLAGALGAVELDPAGVEVSDTEDLERHVTLRARGKSRAERDGVGWSVPFGGRSTLVATLASLPARRDALLVGHPRVALQRFELTLPEGARLLSLPDAKVIESSAARFELAVESKGRKLVVVRTLELRKSRVEASDYEAFRAFCTAVDALGTPRALVTR
ncbi:MAG: DUF3857 domain-containing protein [Deltaproteobacteria bacterium]|nr:DUF3857 domain-containing protein [Deltaproteobacteria bacterium]